MPIIRAKNIAKTKAEKRGKAARLIAIAATKQLPSDVEVRLISRKEVLDRVGVTYPMIWTWMMEGTFPRSRDMGNRKTGWVEAEVNAWILALPIRPLKSEKQKVA
jgi:predicted DNA-binding transcriptional regulator AlpA